MPADKQLFPTDKTCEVCHAAVGSSKSSPGTVLPFVSLSVTIYRRRKGSRQLATCRRVTICESCLVRSIGSRGPGPFSVSEAALLAASLYERVAQRYNAMAVEK